MNKEKMKNFLNKFLKFITKFPVMVILAILIPSLVYTGIYLFRPHEIYNNYYNFGNYLPVNYETFEITEIKPVMEVYSASYVKNYQGGTCYENYYVNCSDNFDALVVYNMDKNKVEHIIKTNQRNTLYHCNQIFFGYDFFNSGDKFPILYISMENEAIHSTIGYRIYEKAGSYVIEQLTKLTLVFDAPDSKLYFPNSYIDYDEGFLYYGGYTKKSYMKSADNKLKYYVFYMPDYRTNHVELNTSEAIYSFELPSETATQGGFISDGHLVETFSFNNKPEDNPERTPRMRVVDLDTQATYEDDYYEKLVKRKPKVIKEYLDLGATFGVYDEFENIAVSNDGRLFGHGNIGFKIYEFKYSSSFDN